MSLEPAPLSLSFLLFRSLSFSRWCGAGCGSVRSLMTRVLCYAVLCCVVLCCIAVLSCQCVLYCTVLCCAVRVCMCCAVLCCVCCVVLCVCAVLCGLLSTGGFWWNQGVQLALVWTVTLPYIVWLIIRQPFAHRLINVFTAFTASAEMMQALISWIYFLYPGIWMLASISMLINVMVAFFFIYVTIATSAFIKNLWRKCRTKLGAQKG